MKVRVTLNCLRQISSLAIGEFTSTAEPLPGGDYTIELDNNVVANINRQRHAGESLGAAIERMCAEVLRQVH